MTPINICCAVLGLHSVALCWRCSSQYQAYFNHSYSQSMAIFLTYSDFCIINREMQLSNQYWQILLIQWLFLTLPLSSKVIFFFFKLTAQEILSVSSCVLCNSVGKKVSGSQTYITTVVFFSLCHILHCFLKEVHFVSRNCLLYFFYYFLFIFTADPFSRVASHKTPTLQFLRKHLSNNIPLRSLLADLFYSSLKQEIKATALKLPQSRCCVSTSTMFPHFLFHIHSEQYLQPLVENL